MPLVSYFFRLICLFFFYQMQNINELRFNTLANTLIYRDAKILFVMVYSTVVWKKSLLCHSKYREQIRERILSNENTGVIMSAANSLLYIKQHTVPHPS